MTFISSHEHACQMRYGCRTELASDRHGRLQAIRGVLLPQPLSFLRDRSRAEAPERRADPPGLAGPGGPLLQPSPSASLRASRPWSLTCPRAMLSLLLGRPSTPGAPMTRRCWRRACGYMAGMLTLDSQPNIAAQKDCHSRRWKTD